MLLQLVTAFQDELMAVRSVFHEGHASGDVDCAIMPYCPLDDGCLISLWDAWNRFMRSIYLGSAAGPTSGIGGQHYTPTQPRDESECLRVLVLAAGQKGSGITISAGEPKWFVVSSVYAIATSLELPNATAIANAVTQNTIQVDSGDRIDNPVEEIRAFRNYVAHKSHAEASRLRAFMSSGDSDLSDHMHEKARGGVTRFDDWVDGLIGLAWDAAL